MKNNKILNGVLIAVIIILLGILIYLQFINNKSSNNIDKIYNNYLVNLKNNIINKYEDYSNNVVEVSNDYLDTVYTFTINKNLNLILTTRDNKYNNYKVSDNVLNMFLIDVGNGGFKYLYFIKDDGSLNKLCIDCIKEEGNVKVEKEDKKYIVNVIQGVFDYEVSGAPGPIFIDINGNIIMD